MEGLFVEEKNKLKNMKKAIKNAGFSQILLKKINFSRIDKSFEF